MIEPVIEPTASGYPTIRFGTRYLYSKVNPRGEAEKVFHSLMAAKPTKVLICLNPCINYFYEIANQTLPRPIILSLYSNSDHQAAPLPPANLAWSPQSSMDLSEFLQTHITESNLEFSQIYINRTYFELFPSESKALADSVGAVLKRISLNRGTSNYFHRRWFLNCLKNLIHLPFHTVQVRGKGPIAILASGPSLPTSLANKGLSLDRTYRCALPSSLAFCQSSGISVQLCFQTDGGYWAGRHLGYLGPQTSLCLSLRSLVPGSVARSDRAFLAMATSLMEQFLWSFFYSDSLPTLPDSPTVALSAAYALPTIQEGPGVFLGLDMATLDLQSHVQPHSFGYEAFREARRTNPGLNLLYGQFRASESQRLQPDRPWFLTIPTRSFRQAAQDARPHLPHMSQIGPPELATFPLALDDIFAPGNQVRNPVFKPIASHRGANRRRALRSILQSIENRLCLIDPGEGSPEAALLHECLGSRIVDQRAQVRDLIATAERYQ